MKTIILILLLAAAGCKTVEIEQFNTNPVEYETQTN